MKFALGAAAAITGASALIYLLLRPKKRHLDPGKRRHGDAGGTENDVGSVRGREDSYAFRNFNGHVVCGERDGADALSGSEANRYSYPSVEDLSLDSSVGDICEAKKQRTPPLEKDFSLDGDDDGSEKEPRHQDATSEVVEQSSLSSSSERTAAKEETFVGEEVEISRSVVEDEILQKEKTQEILGALPCEDKIGVALSTFACNESAPSPNEIEQVVFNSVLSPFNANSSEKSVSSGHENVASDSCQAAQSGELERTRCISVDVSEEVSSSDILENSNDAKVNCLGSACSEASDNQKECPSLLDKNEVSNSTSVGDISSTSVKEAENNSNFEGNASGEASEGGIHVHPDLSEVGGKTEPVSIRENLEQECSSSSDKKEEESDGLSHCHTGSSKLQDENTPLTKALHVDNSELKPLDVNEGSELMPAKADDSEECLHATVFVESHTREDGSWDGEQSVVRSSSDLAEKSNSDAFGTTAKDSQDVGQIKEHQSLLVLSPVENRENIAEEKECDLKVVKDQDDNVGSQNDFVKEKISESEEKILSPGEKDVEGKGEPLEVEVKCSKFEQSVVETAGKVSQVVEEVLEHVESIENNLALEGKTTSSEANKCSGGYLAESGNEVTERGLSCEDAVRNDRADIPSNQNFVGIAANQPKSQMEGTSVAVTDVEISNLSDVEASVVQESSGTITNKNSSGSESEGRRSYKRRVRNSCGSSESSASECPAEEKKLKDTECSDWEGKESYSEGSVFESKLRVTEKESSWKESVTPNTVEEVAHACGVRDSETNSARESKRRISEGGSSATDPESKRSYKGRVRNSRGPSESSASDCTTEKMTGETLCLDLDQAEKELFSLIDDSQDDSKTSFVIKEKPAATTPSKTRSKESASSSHAAQESVLTSSTEETSKSAKEESSITHKSSKQEAKQEPSITHKSSKQELAQNKSSKSKTEGPGKAPENSRNRSYKERVRNSRGNSLSETTQKSDVENNNRYSVSYRF